MIYERLSEVTLDCIQQVRFDEDARKVFTTKAVQDSLRSIQDSVIRALELISAYYSKPRGGMSLLLVKRSLLIEDSDRVAPSAREIDALVTTLEKQKAQMSHAFMVEIAKKIREMQESEALELRRIREFQEKEAKERVRREREEGERRLLKGKEKEGSRLKQKYEAEEAKLRRFLFQNNSLHIGKARCLSGTRVAILARLEKWARDNTPYAIRLFWLHARAGYGKSAIAATICQILEELGLLTGSFFCKRDEEGRRNPIHLIGHLAYYVARANPAFREALLESLEDPAFFVTTDRHSYFDFALKKPLSKVKNSAFDGLVVFVIDALDECNDHDDVARFLVEVVADAPWLRLIMTSRDQPQIRKAITACALREEHDLLNDDARDDIRKLVDYELGPNGRLAGVGSFFEDRKDDFVARSQGRFIWLDTFIKFVDRNIRTLDTLDKRLGQESFPDGEDSLDLLYRIIIGSAAEKSGTSEEVVRLIIGFIVASSRTEPLQPRIIHAFLPPSLLVTLSTVETILAHMSAVFIVSPHGVVAVHMSVLDFSADKKRCGEKIWSDSVDIQQIMAAACLDIMERGTRNVEQQQNGSSGLRFNICNLETSYLANSEVPDLNQRIEENISPELRYSCVYWMDHVVGSQSKESGTRSRDDGGSDSSSILQAVATLLCTTRSLFWLEVMSLCGALQAARGILLRVDALEQVSCFDDLLLLKHV